MYKLVLPNGTEIKGLLKNGTNYVAFEKVDEKLFDGVISELTIINDYDGIIEEVFINAVLVQQEEYENQWYLCFRELSERELLLRELEEKFSEKDKAVEKIEIQISSQSDQMDFYEDCISEMAAVVYE